MECPYCGSRNSRVVDSREAGDQSIRRRRECMSCNKRFTTYEVIEMLPILVVKRDGTRQVFDRNKVLNGMLRACDKRPVALSTLETVASEIEQHIQNEMEHEVEAKEIGEMVMARLKELDQVAYVRFASVYRQFKDITGFMAEIQQLLGKA